MRVVVVVTAGAPGLRAPAGPWAAHQVALRGAGDPAGVEMAADSGAAAGAAGEVAVMVAGAGVRVARAADGPVVPRKRCDCSARAVG